MGGSDVHDYSFNDCPPLPYRLPNNENTLESVSASLLLIMEPKVNLSQFCHPKKWTLLSVFISNIFKIFIYIYSELDIYELNSKNSEVLLIFFEIFIFLFGCTRY